MKHTIRYVFLGYHFFCVAAVLNAQLIAAHRGASYDAPENTIASFTLAWEQGADAIETDFHLTSDQRIVCIHDPTTERVSGKKLTVAKATLSELQGLDIGSWKDPRFADLRLPSLSEVLALVPSNKGIYIEIKCGPEIVPLMQHALSDSQLLPSQTIFISFKQEVIHAVKQAMPERQAYWLVSFEQDEKSGQWSPTVDELIATAKKNNANGVDLNANPDIVDARLIRRCRQAGLSVHIWTVDDPERALLYQRLGVDSITTNQPGELRKVLFPPEPASPVTRGPTDTHKRQPAAAP